MLIICADTIAASNVAFIKQVFVDYVKLQAIETASKVKNSFPGVNYLPATLTVCKWRVAGCIFKVL